MYADVQKVGIGGAWMFILATVPSLMGQRISGRTSLMLIGPIAAEQKLLAGTPL
jgi:hypothetical protein